MRMTHKVQLLQVSRKNDSDAVADTSPSNPSGESSGGATGEDPSDQQQSTRADDETPSEQNTANETGMPDDDTVDDKGEDEDEADVGGDDSDNAPPSTDQT